MAQICRSLVILIASLFLLMTSLDKSVKSANSAHPEPKQNRGTQGGDDAAPVSFRWISRTRDQHLWEKVRSAFAEELKQDAKGGASPDAVQYRYLDRVGVGGNTAFVSIGNRNDPKVTGFDFFDVFSFDLGTGSKKKIVADTLFYLLRFKGLAHLERSHAPDLIFEYKDCVECEPAALLAAFGLMNNGWSLRNWDGSGKNLGLGGTQDPEGDVVERIEHAYRIGDFAHTGNDQIAVWIRIREVAAEDPSKIYSQSSSTVVYGLSNEKLQGEEILEPSRTVKIHSWICSAPSIGSVCQSRF